MSNSDDSDVEIKGIAHSDKLTMVDRLRAKLHSKIDRNDAGQVVYPRREYLQNQAMMRKRAEDEEKARGGK